jgi:glutamate dehydrogenase (NADP+)
MTGKEPDWGGSFIRTEATGYGTVYFAAEMLATKGEDLTGKSCLVSGSGNVAQYTAQKLLDMGARLLTMSDSDGFVLDPDGIDRDKLDWLMDMKHVRRGRIREYAERFPRSTYVPAQPNGENPLWDVPADCAFPCATQNEISAKDAANLLRNGVVLVAEGANMPTTSRGVELFVDAGILYGPAKAANAGGVAVSGLEMAQDSAHLPWPTAQVDAKLRAIMRDIHGQVRRAAEEYGAPGNYVAGANIAGFVKVAGAMLDEGTI